MTLGSFSTIFAGGVATHITTSCNTKKKLGTTGKYSVLSDLQNWDKLIYCNKCLLMIDPPRIANLLSAGQHNLNYFVVRKEK